MSDPTNPPDAPDTDRIRAVAAEVGRTAATLRASGRDHVARTLARAAALLADPETPLGADARRLLPSATGLSAPMVDWALRTSLEPVTFDALSTLAHRLAPSDPRYVAAPPRLVAVVLSGNVFTASVRAVLVPLLLGAPLIAKASSREDLFPRLLARALEEADPGLARSFFVLTFPGGTVDLEDALFAQADVVSVYGHDATLAAVRGRLAGTTRFVPHGHGLGVVHVPAAALIDEDAARRVADAVALDVAAYDQRGCLSPHVVWVERGARIDARAFAALLSRSAFATLARRLPRGPLPTAAGAAQLQWRGVAAARGELFEGDGWAVSFEGEGPLRLSPGYRNVSVLEHDGVDDLAQRLLPLGVHLKSVGVAGDAAARRALADALPPPLAPRVCAAGTMQTPPLDALADGDLPAAGLLRLIDLD